MDCPREDEELPFPVQCETDPTGSDGVVVYGDLSNPIHSDCPREDEELPPPVECETDPIGSDGVGVYGDLSYPIHSPRLSLPVHRVPSPTDLNEVMVYDHSCYPILSVENHQPRDRASCVDNPSDVRGGLEQQWGSEETHNQKENLLFRPHGHLAPGGVPVTWWSHNGPWVGMAITAVTVLLILRFVN